MLNTFAQHVATGLNQRPRNLSSMYIYDEKGSRLFQEIMQMPEYYLTRTEYAILKHQRQDIALMLAPRAAQGLDIIEFGAGDGTKTQLLLDYFSDQDRDFRYLPIDISTSALEGLTQKLKARLPQLVVEPVVGEYFESLQTLSTGAHANRHKLVLFLGSNVGNFSHQEAVDFFRHMHEVLRPGDQVLVGFDLKKSPERILAAYQDEEGITAAFNQNILARINRELGGNFDLSQFRYVPTYNPESGEVSAYQMSLCDQEVYIEALDASFHFNRWDTIHTEVSRKYSLETIEFFAATSGFQVEAHFSDAKGYFSDSLWTRQP